MFNRQAPRRRLSPRSDRPGAIAVRTSPAGGPWCARWTRPRTDEDQKMAAFLGPFVAFLLMTAPDGPFAAPAGPRTTASPAERLGARVAATAVDEARRPEQVRLAIV